MSATENAVSSLGKVLEFQPEVVDSQQGKSLADTWIQALPLTEDTVEAVKVHSQLVRFIEKSDPRWASATCKKTDYSGRAASTTLFLAWVQRSPMLSGMLKQSL